MDLQRLRALRHDLHRHPELGFAEHRTQGVVRAWLEELGVEARECAGTGLVADLSPGSDGPTIALRADLDALPIHERTELPYRSVHDGVAHKCGHDGHTTILMGVAEVLAARRGELSGNVRLLFQPAEEGARGGGGRVMVAEGALDGVAEVYGLHNWPGFAKGDVRVIAGPTMAEVRSIELVLRGKGGHASQPQRCQDPIAAGAQVVTALNTILSRNVGFRGGGVVSVCAFQAGTADNVIPNTARLLGTIRFFDPTLGDKIVRRVDEVVRGTARAMGVEADLSIREGYPVLVNDASCADAVHRVAAQLFGAERVSAEGLPLAASEDFAYLAQAVPAAYFFLGAGRPGEETPSCHHADFDFDDDLIEPGVRLLTGIAADRLSALQPDAGA